MQSQGALSFTELVLNASLLVQCVMLFLLLLSVISWTIIISRNNQYRVGRAKADEFEDRFWSGIDLNNLYQECMKRPDELVGLEVIYSAGFKEFVRLVNSGPADQDVVMDGTYRQMKVACSREVELLENHLPTLATIGSISPYIGLFGTVWGIMHAFVSLAAVKNATLAMVAPPIAEALIATAMGLFAAIPAVMFYNRFVTKVEALENRYYNFMDEFSTILNRRLVTIRSQFNRNNSLNQTNLASTLSGPGVSQQLAPSLNPGSGGVELGATPNGRPQGSFDSGEGLNPSIGGVSLANNDDPSNMGQVTHGSSGDPNKYNGGLSEAEAIAAASKDMGAPVNAPGAKNSALASNSMSNIGHGIVGGMANRNFSANAAANAAGANANTSRSSNRQGGLNSAHSTNGGAANQTNGLNKNRAANQMNQMGQMNHMGMNGAANTAEAGSLNQGINPGMNQGLSSGMSNGLSGGLNAMLSPNPGANNRQGRAGANSAMANAMKGANNGAPLNGGMSGVNQGNMRNDGPIYRAGAEFDRPRPKVPDEEPHYITPGGQNPRRSKP